MTFTTGKLLLVFPALLLGIGLSELSWRLFPVVGIRSKDFVAGRDASYMLRQIEEADRFPPGAPPLDEDTVNTWLVGQLPDSHLSLRRFMIPAKPDPWYHPFQFVRNRTLPDGRVIAKGVYSLGEDGRSASEGNDPDDLNTWDDRTDEYYRRQWERQSRLGHLVLGILFTPITYTLLLGGLALVKRRRK